MARPDSFEPGTLIRIPLDDDMHTYGRMLSDSPFIAIYDNRTSDENPDPQTIVASPVLFVVSAGDAQALKTGRWKKVGNVPLTEADVPIPLRFMQSLGDPRRVRLLDHLGNAQQATLEQCAGLERAAVWDAIHIEERLNDHYAGRPNAHLASMKLIVPE